MLASVITSATGRIWMRLSLLSLMIYLTNGENNLTKKKVCVIGAGPSGLFTVKQLAQNLDEFEPIVFEKSADIGGMWMYTDSDDFDEHGLPVHSGIYKNMRTTAPKEMMACPDFDFKGENRSCVGHETVLEYLKNYTDHFNLRPFIKFNTLVNKVVPVPENDDWRKTKWLVRAQNLNTNASDEITCNFMIVCNGHEYQPLVPNIPGIETFPGRVLHSHSYRRPEEFSNQTVVILGASASGTDLTFELSNFVKTIYLSHRHEKIVTDMPKNVVQVRGVIAAKGRDLILQDDSTIKADSFIFCTGYKHDFPFLEASSGLKFNDKFLYPLYKQVVNIEHPSMGFVGFPSSIAYFCPKFETAAKYYVSLIRGKAELPCREEMMKDAEFMVPGNPEMDKPGWQWNFLTELAKDGGFEPLGDFYRQGQDLWQYHRSNNLRHHKEYDLRMLDNGSIIIVKSRF